MRSMKRYTTSEVESEIHSLLLSKEYRKALQLIHILIERSTDPPIRLHKLRAKIFEKLEQWDEVVDECQKIHKIKPIANIYLLRGKALQIIKRDGEAIEEYQNAFKKILLTDPAYHLIKKAHLNLIQRIKKTRKFDLLISLPPELFHYLLGWLNFSDIVKLCSICTTWRKFFFKDSFAFKHIFINQSMRSKAPFEARQIIKRYFAIAKDDLQAAGILHITDVENLLADPDRNKVIQRSLNYLHITFESTNDKIRPLCLESLRCIRIDNIRWDQISALQNLKNLECLIISYRDKTNIMDSSLISVRIPESVKNIWIEPSCQSRKLPKNERMLDCFESVEFGINNYSSFQETVATDIVNNTERVEKVISSGLRLNDSLCQKHLKVFFGKAPKISETIPVLYLPETIKEVFLNYSGCGINLELFANCCRINRLGLLIDQHTFVDSENANFMLENVEELFFEMSSHNPEYQITTSFIKICPSVKYLTLKNISGEYVYLHFILANCKNLLALDFINCSWLTGPIALNLLKYRIPSLKKVRIQGTLIHSETIEAIRLSGLECTYMPPVELPSYKRLRLL